MNHRQNHFTKVDCLGLKCSGPGSLRDTVLLLQYIPCPFKTTLDLDNAFLKKEDGRIGRIVKLSKRCAACDANNTLRKLLRSPELTSDHATGCCSSKHCFKPSWGDTKFCYKHLARELESLKCRKPDFKGLKETLTAAMSKQWVPTEDLNVVMALTAEIEEGKRLGSDLVILDAEYVPSGKLLEFTIIEKLSGNVLIDIKVRHNYFHSAPDEVNPMGKKHLITHRKALKFWGPARKGWGQEGLGPDDIAKELKKVGITQRTVFIVWATSYKDIWYLRDLLESAGYPGIIPGNENCLRMIPIIWANVPPTPGRTRAPAKLDILFPLFFPCHHLVGQNHRSYTDCLQTRLMIMAFEELCKSASTSNHWKPKDLDMYFGPQG